MRDFSDVVRSAISHKATLDSSRRDVKDNSILIEKKEKELQELNELYRITKQSHSYLDVLVKEESGKFIKRLNDILDYGVKTIFDDCDYSIEIRVSDNDKATIHLVYEDEDGNKLDPNIQSVGGGIRTIVGFLLQVFYIYHYRVEPIIFVDEGFSQISSQYIGNFFSLIKELASKNNLKVLLITHDERFIRYADKRYIIQDGSALEIESKDKEVDDNECDSAESSE